MRWVLLHRGGVIAGTPTLTIDAWNADVGVSLVVVGKGDTCGARVSAGEVNFLACMGPTERHGGTGCGFTTHELGEKDSLKCPVVKMVFPETGEGFAILVKPLGSLVKRPKVFSISILSRQSLPYPVMIDWDLPLTLFKFKAREWKFLIKENKGSSWFASLWMGVDPTRPSPALEIPSSQLGREFASSEFENRPDNDRSHVSEPPEEEEVTGSPSLRDDGVASLFPPRSDASQRSSRSNRSGNSTVPPPPVERLAPLL